MRIHPLRLVVALSCLAVPRGGFGWAGREHRALGAESYIAACNRLAPFKDRDPETAARYDMACGHLESQSFLYAQATAVSGDFLASPRDFTTALGVSKVTRDRHYWRLALTNSAHFHPLATREWRDFHQDAIKEALAAVKMQGVAQIEGFEQAFYDSAFGDHFLQDSFSAGHMGFNRPGSSATAAKDFHDVWNRRGRMVSNRNGAVWKTYGDGRLDREENRESRKHVLAACTESVYGVLSAFVLGEYDPAADFAVWHEVIFAIEDPEILPKLERLFGGSETLERPKIMPLLAVKRPAYKDGVLGVWSPFTFTFDDPGHPTGGLVFGGDMLVPKLLDTRMEAGIGFGFDSSFSSPRAVVDAGLVTRVGLNFSGLLTHELDLGALFVFPSGLDVTLRLSYRINVEAGDWLLRFDLGPSLSVAEGEFGTYAALGISKLMSSAGGGAF